MHGGSLGNLLSLLSWCNVACGVFLYLLSYLFFVFIILLFIFLYLLFYYLFVYLFIFVCVECLASVKGLDGQWAGFLFGVLSVWVLLMVVESSCLK